MSGVAVNELPEPAAKLQRYLFAANAESSGDMRQVEEALQDGLNRSASSISDPLVQRWIIYLSNAVNLRYRRLGWLTSRINNLSQRHTWRNVVDQSDLAVLNLCETYHQLVSVTDTNVWADGFATFLQSGAAGNIATHMLLFRETGFNSDALDVISTELLFALDMWLSKVPENFASEETIAQLTTLCSELLRHPKSVEYFLKATQLTESDETYDGLTTKGGLEFLFTSAYQLFPLYPMPVTKLFSACSSGSKEGAVIVRNVFSNMGCFAVQLPSSFPVTSIMQLSHQNEFGMVVLQQAWKPPGGLHLVLPAGTKGMVLSHWPENGAIQRVLFTYKYNAFDWFAAVTSSVASDAVQLDDGTVLDLLTEVAKLFCGLAKNLDVPIWYETTFSILGPFSRLAPCLNAVRESPQLVRQVVAIVASVINFFAALAVRCPEEVAVIVDDYWAPVLLGGLYGELLSTYECRFADFQITSAICSLMASFLETKYFEWMYGATLRKNLVALIDSFLHTALANVATWRFTYLKKRVDHLRNIYALAALIFDVYNSAGKSADSFNNLFIIDPLLSHVSNSLPSKVIDFILSITDTSTASPFSGQQKLVQPSLQSLISAFLSCMLRLYRFVNNGANKWDVVSSIAVGSAELARAVVFLTTSTIPPSSALVLNENNRRLCFDLVSLIVTVLGHGLSLNGLLSPTERKQFQAFIIDTISEEEKYVTTESAGNTRLLLIQSTMGLVEATMQFQPTFFADLAPRIRPLVMSIITRFELYQSLPSLYLASLRIIAAAWRFGRHQNFAKQLVDDSGQQNFWASIVYPLEVDVAKDGSCRKSQILSLLTVLDILSLEMFNFTRPGSSVGLDASLTSKLTSVFENGFFNSRLESIFDYLLLNDEEGEYFPTSPTCSSAASSVQTFVETLATCNLPQQLIKPRQQLEVIDSCVSVCLDLLTDLRSLSESAALRRTIALSRVLLPSFLRAIVAMVRNWAKTAFIQSSRSRAVAKSGAAINSSAQGLFAKCIELCRMMLSAASVGEELPLRFDESGVMSLTLVAELLTQLREDSSLDANCRSSFGSLVADIITQLLATESDSRVVPAFYSAAFAVINLLISCAPDVVPVLVKNEIFVCKLVECTAKALQDGSISEINVDALVFLLNVVHAINASCQFGEQRQQAFSVKRILSSLSNAFYNHAFLECCLAGSQPGVSVIQRTATQSVIDILTAMIMHTDGEKNFFLPVDTACTFLSVYTCRFVKLATHLVPASDSVQFSICFAWTRLIERISSRLSQHDQALYQSDLNLVEIIRVLFMNAFVLLNNYRHSPSNGAGYSEDNILRMCACALNALLRVSPSLVHIIHGDIFRGGRQVMAIVEPDFSLVSLGSSSPKQTSASSRMPQTLTFGFLFACFHATFRRLRRPSDGGGHESLSKHHATDQGMIAIILHSLLQLAVSQAVLHLQLITCGGQQQFAQQQSGAAIAAFNDQIKPELGACFVRFRRFVSSIPSSTLSPSDADDFQALTGVYEQILCH